MRLSFLYRQPYHEVLQWPRSSVAMAAAYLAKEPAPEERLEATFAQACALYANAHRKKGAAPHRIADFLLFDDAWKPEPADEDESITAFALSFGMVKRRGDHHR
jgi:hypothetical protein